MRPGPATTPLWASMWMTFLNSLGTLVVTSGVYYLTRHTYGFSEVENYLLGAVLGGTYIVGSLGSHGLAARVSRLIPGTTSRRLLSWMMGAMALLCCLPIAIKWAQPVVEGVRPASWPIWLLVGVYSPLTGVLWPIVESYVSGGLAGGSLRRTIGAWNVCWSTALIVGSVAIAPLTKSHGAEAIALLGSVHAACLVLLRWFGPDPGTHGEGGASGAEGGHAPEPYPALLATFRILLPMSYFVNTGLTPFLATVMDRVGIAVGWQTPTNAIWLLGRTAGFWWLQRGAGWHGRWWLAIAAPIALIAGFSTSLLSGRLGEDGLGLLLGGLALQGVGMAGIYAGAIYYAMAVGRAEVKAGGAHEALIGVGYTTGPLLGAGVFGATRAGWIPRAWFGPIMIGCVALVALVVLVVVARRVRSMSGDAGRGGTERAGSRI